MSEEIVAKGKIFELVQIQQDDGRIFEVARRAPGVRVVIVDDAAKKILLTKEFRHELEEWDYRLPGGKVFDTLDEFAAFRMRDEDILLAAKAKAVAEAREEAGIEVEEIEFVEKSTLGATVEWDLYVFVAHKWSLSSAGQELEIGEMIEADVWVGFEEARRMILVGDMKEGRVALILLQWLEGNGHVAAK